jgi:hypothetical protein
MQMPRTALSLGLLLLFCLHSNASARDAYASWDNRCEECHGDADAFASKYLWVVDGKLQGQHHVDDLQLFMHNHYIPDHEIEKMTEMLQAQANNMARYVDECGNCHGRAQEFVRTSINTWGDEPVGVESGIPISEYLQSHQGLTKSGAEFFVHLITRVLSQIPRQ